MPVIWTKADAKWELVAPAAFVDERALHDLIEEAPHTLPLSGKPELVMVGREVQLGTMSADLIAVERSGRIVVIEVKLERNAQARRSIVAQVLSYASHLHGLTRSEFEEVVRPRLPRGCANLTQALAAGDQERAFNAESFFDALQTNLAKGDFRLVMVLDGAPSELVRIAGYLEAVGSNLLVDVVVVSSYRVGDAMVIVPERIDHSREPRQPPATEVPSSTGVLSEGSDAFEESIALASEADRPRLIMLLGWARTLESEGLVNLFTFSGISPRWTLLPRLPRKNAGLVTIWNERREASLQFWRSVFERTAPSFIAPIEAKVRTKLGQGTPTVYDFDDELLELLTQAYGVASKAQ
jgi:hypothetical protein